MTAVEYIYKIIHARIHIDKDLSEYLNQAKEMEKQQIIDAFEKGFLTTQWDKTKENKAEKYYNEIFKNIEQ